LASPDIRRTTLAAATKFSRGALKGKKIEFASSERIEELRSVADDFMLEIFDFLPGEYLITDASSLRDFTDMASADTSPIWRLITERFAIERTDVPSEKLVDVFAEIQARKSVQ
jgi:hypothetical protein